MFKKLKEKITEEVKISPQRFQQLTQSVSDRLQNSATSDENFFSIGDDDANTSNASLEPGFSNVSLTSPQESRFRRNSNSSIASDMSFLPRYESLHNMYHLQSDLDVSASEIEDNASTSSQLGHLSKEQIYSAFQKAQVRYHKYRGRYTDLAKHYKDLERENIKMKSVLVETQDKAIRRVTELKEQCALEQKAKAHLEGALRDDLDEKQLKIESLQTKIGLLQNGANSYQGSETLDTLNKYLTDARLEIENLNAKIQEMKAYSIIFQTKEQEYKLKIGGLEKEISLFSDREKENNLTLAQNKMELHNELLRKDAEINKLKQDNEVFKQNLDTLSNGNLKMENLQIQNKKLIDKLENLTQKCNSYENELLRMEQYKIEIQMSNHTNAELKDRLKDAENKLDQVREDAKNSLFSLESKVREKIENEFKEKERQLRVEFQKKFEEVSSNADNLQEIQLKLIEKDEEIKRLTDELNHSLEELSAKSLKYNDLEQNHLELIEDSAGLRNKISHLEKELSINQNEGQDLVIITANESTGNEEIAKFVSQLKELEENIQEKTKDNIKLLEDLEESRTNTRHLEELVRSLDLKLLTSLQENENNVKTLAETSDHLTSKNEEIYSLQNKLKHLETENENISASLNEFKLLQGNCQTLGEKLDLSEKQIAKSILETKQLRENLASNGDQIHDLNEKLTSQLNEYKRLEEERNSLAEKLHTNEDKIIFFQETNSSLQVKCQNFEEEVKKLVDDLEIERRSQGDLQNLDEINIQLKNELSELQKIIEDHEARQAANEDKVKKLESTIEELSNELNSTQDLIARKDVEITTLTQQQAKVKTVEEDNTSFQEENNLLKKLLEEANNNCTIKDHELVKIREDFSSSKKKMEEFNEQMNERSRNIKAYEDQVQLKNQQMEILSKKIEDYNKLIEERNDGFLQILNKVLDQPINNFKTNNDNKNLYSIEDKLHHFEKTFFLEKENLAKILIHLKEFEERYSSILNKNETLVNEIRELQGQIRELKSVSAVAKKIEEEVVRVKEENRLLGDEIENFKQNVLELQSRNTQVVSDSNFLSEENQGLVTEVEELKLKNDALKTQFNNTQFEITSQKNEINELTKKVEELSSNEQQLVELEKHIGELHHEKQLLQDEIQELKIVPISIQNNKLDDKEESYVKEIENLRLKVTQYKSLDLTNKSSIEFYENELQKLKNQNEKLNRKLDETLVTLNHCAELSNSTEIEYLKNVLYNYMLGKESLVLARVIAAVCKFDPHQTETILAKEQQKQTLLGQLGIL